MSIEVMTSTSNSQPGNNTPAIEPFFFPGGEPGVLLIHGFLAAPDEVRPLGEALAAAGMTVSGIRLRGHGTHPADLASVHWQDWVADVRAGLATLRQHCSHIGLAGISLGAALALYVAAEEPVERLVAFAAPSRAATRGLPRTWIAQMARILPYLPKIGSDMRDAQVRRARHLYQQIPLQAAAEVAALFEATEARLPAVRTPTLLVHAQHDRVVPPRAAREVAARLGGPHALLWLKRGGHTVILDYDRERAWQAARDWFLAKTT